MGVVQGGGRARGRDLVTALLRLALLAFLVAACGTEPSNPPAGRLGGAEAAQGPASEAEPADPTPSAITVFAAASLAEAFRALGDAFVARHPGSEVAFSFAGSQQLATQILAGARADVFASANAAQMERVVAGGAVDGAAPRVFATNHLVVVHPADNPAGIKALGDLARPGIKLVLAAPDVPAGAYAREMLDAADRGAGVPAGFRDAVLANVVSNESDVQAVASKVALGEADAGIVYASDAGGRLAERLGQLDVPKELAVRAAYPIAPVAESRHPGASAAFVAFVRSAEGRAVLVAHGFGVP